MALAWQGSPFYASGSSTRGIAFSQRSTSRSVPNSVVISGERFRGRQGPGECLRTGDGGGNFLPLLVFRKRRQLIDFLGQQGGKRSLLFALRYDGLLLGTFPVRRFGRRGFAFRIAHAHYLSRRPSPAMALWKSPPMRCISRRRASYPKSRGVGARSSGDAHKSQKTSQ